MIESNEPKDGDFIAYIEDLQKQQAARLVANRPQSGPVPAAPTKTAQDSGSFESRARPTSAAEAQRAARERLQQFALPLAKLVGAALPLLVGAVIGLHWLIAGSNPLQLIIALFLLAYGVRHLKRALQGFSPAERARASALVAQLMAKSDRR